MPGAAAGPITLIDKKRKKAFQRVLRLIVIRGFAWYHGVRYTNTTVGQLCSLEEFKEYVRHLYQHDNSVSGDVLRAHGLWEIIHPPQHTNWTGFDVILEGARHAQFGFDYVPVRDREAVGLPAVDDLEEQNHTWGWRLTRVDAGSPAARAGLLLDDVVLQINQVRVHDVSDATREQQQLSLIVRRPDTVVEEWIPVDSVNIDVPVLVEATCDAQRIAKPVPTIPATSGCSRPGSKYRGPIDWYTSFNIDTLKSHKPDKDVLPLPPGKLVEFLLYVRMYHYSAAFVQAHRWQFTGQLFGRIQGFIVFVAGANRQGAPEGLIMSFDETWREASFSSQIVPLVGRINTYGTGARVNAQIIRLSTAWPRATITRWGQRSVFIIIWADYPIKSLFVLC